MSKKMELAGVIAGALAKGERSMNQAALDLFAIGTAVFEARNSGEFHPLESQREVERLAVATSNLITAIGEVARVHDRLWEKAQSFAEGSGGLCPWPTPATGHAEANVVPIVAAA